MGVVYAFESSAESLAGVKEVVERFAAFISVPQLDAARVGYAVAGDVIMHRLTERSPKLANDLGFGQHVSAGESLTRPAVRERPSERVSPAPEVSVDATIMQAQEELNLDTPLNLAIRRGDSSRVEKLLRDGADVAAAGVRGWTPLHAAAVHKQHSLIELLLKRGAPIDARDPDGNTPLHLAVTFGRGDITSALLSHGASLDARNNSGQTALHLAAGALDAMLDLFEVEISMKMVDVARRDPERALTLYSEWVVEFGPETGGADRTKMLIARGANVSIGDDEGNTPLHVAAREGRKDDLQVLLDAGADPSIRNKEGLTPLDLAKDDDTGDILRLLHSDGTPLDGF